MYSVRVAQLGHSGSALPPEHARKGSVHETDSWMCAIDFQAATQRTSPNPCPVGGRQHAKTRRRRRGLESGSIRTPPENHKTATVQSSTHLAQGRRSVCTAKDTNPRMRTRIRTPLVIPTKQNTGHVADAPRPGRSRASHESRTYLPGIPFFAERRMPATTPTDAYWKRRRRSVFPDFVDNRDWRSTFLKRRGINSAGFYDSDAHIPRQHGFSHY